MKIGVFTNFYPPSERGGAELVAQRIADELAFRGHKVSVLTTRPFAGLHSLHPELTEAHLERVFRFFPFNLYHISNASQYPFFLRILWHWIDLFGPFPKTIVDTFLNREEVDVVLTHNLKGLGVSAAARLQRAGVRHIHTLHDVQLSVPSGVLFWGKEQGVQNTGWIRRVYEGCMKAAIGSPDLVISPSHFLADFYRARGFFLETEMRVMPNPAPKPSDRMRRPQQVPQGPLRFLFVGQLEIHKGIDVLLEAADAMTIPIQLHLAGEGTQATRVDAHAKQNPIIFSHGFLPLEHIRRLLSQCDAVILPSICYENSPTILYESFQMGVPVIASNIGGIPELVTHNENGLLIEPGNVQSLVTAMNAFFTRREEFWKKADTIRKTAEVYSLKRYVDELEGLLKKE